MLAAWSIISSAIDGVWLIFMELDSVYKITLISGVLVFFVASYRFLIQPILGGHFNSGSDMVKRNVSSQARIEQKGE